LGNINGQDGWSKTGPYDHAVSPSGGTIGFGSQSLRISNAVTSGSFGDMSFSRPLANEAGETTAANGGLSGGTRQNYFESQFSIASMVPGAQQPGLLMSMSPDRGDGARMSYLRFEDFIDGIHVFFSEYKDNAPFGGSVGDPAGCASEDDFADTDIATLNRAVPHTIKIAIFFLDGPRNDVVQVYIDGVLVKTGTSWEDFFRFCEGNPTRTVDSMLIRTAGPAVPANAGNGFLIDNMGNASTTNATPTMVVDADGQASLTDCNAPDTAFTTIGSAVAAATPGNTIRICPGTYTLPSTVNLNKALTLMGIGTRPLIKAASGIGNAFFVTASGVTLDNLELQKTDLANQNLIGVQADNFTAKNNLIYGPDPGVDWNTAGVVSRGFVISANNNINLQNNIIHHLRQPAYMSGSDTSGGTISGNQVSGTKGWVVEGGNFAFSGNTFGEPQNQSGDIALLANLSAANIAFYQPLLSLSTNNDNARVDAQYAGGEAGRAVSYVNASAAPGGNGSDNANYQTITAGIAGALKGGTVSVAGGTYGESVNVNKNVTVKGSFTITGTLTTSVTGATLSPGNSPGIINSGSLSLTGGSNVDVELNGTTVGTQYDQLNVTGSVSLGGATLNVSTGFTPTPGNTFIIVNNDGNDPVTGTFNSLPEGATVFGGGNAFSISYAGGDGNDVVLTAIALCNIVSIPTNITTLTGNTVTAPINVDDTTGHGLFSADFRLTYNPAVVTAAAVNLGSVTTGRTLTFNVPTPGTLVVSIFGSTPMAGSGTLATVTFNAVGSPGTSSSLNFSSFKFNEGTPCLSTSNGLITILSGTITGTVTYANSVSPVPVPNTTLSATGSVNVSTTSAFNTGAYSLTGLGSGPYTVTPSKSGDVNGLSGFDSALIAQHVVGLITLNATQLMAADVSANNTVTSFDAALIARYVALLPGSGVTGTWMFSPVNRTYPNVETNQTGQDYGGILMGEVSGNWVPPTSFARELESYVAEKSEQAVVPIPVIAPISLVNTGSNFTVPVTVGDTTGQGILSYEFDLTYNPGVIQLQASPVDVTGTISNGMNVTTNVPTPGTLKVVVFGTTARTGAGTLFNLKFSAIGSTGSTTPLTWSRFLFNEDPDLDLPTNGQLTLVGPTAAGVSVGGILMTAIGRPVTNTLVIITDTNGEKRTTTSDASGLFRFSEVQVGQTYVITVKSRKLTFTPQAVSVWQELTNLTLIANP
jgi:hypothetical protein